MAYRVGRCLLKQVLKEKKMSQQELADKSAISRQRISDYANDRIKMSVETLKTVSVILRCDMHDLYEWQEE